MDKELRTEFDLDGLIMRAWREDDIETLHDLVFRNREHLHTYMQWMTPDYAIESTRNFVLRSIESRLERKTLALALERDGELIGSTGFNRLEWAARVCEIGYWIASDEVGKGIITRACQVMIDYAFDELEMNRVEIRCSSENTRSAAIPERLGFKLEGILREAEVVNGRAHDFCIYGLLAEDPRLW